MKRLVVHWSDGQEVLSVNVTVRVRERTNGHAQGVFQAMLLLQGGVYAHILSKDWTCSVWDFDRGLEHGDDLAWKAQLEGLWENNEANANISYYGSY